MKLEELYVKWLVWRGKALDIWSSNAYPSHVLSNLCSNRFTFEGVFCHSMEGFLQSLKYKEPDKQRQICAMKGSRARTRTTTAWQTDQVVWWKGSAIDRQGDEFQALIRRAYKTMFEQNERFRTALMSTRGLKLYHSRGVKDSYRTILTGTEFCAVLTEMRDAYDARKDEMSTRKKRLYFGMEGVLVNLNSGVARQDGLLLEQNERHYDDMPGLIGTMQPMPGAVEAVRRLNDCFDCYILSTASWGNPSAWGDRVSWITGHMDDVFHERMLFTPCKSLCKGDILIDVGGDDGAGGFDGEWIQFGSEKFPDWDVVLDYLVLEKRCSKEIDYGSDVTLYCKRK